MVFVKAGDGTLVNLETVELIHLMDVGDGIWNVIVRHKTVGHRSFLEVGTHDECAAYMDQLTAKLSIRRLLIK